MISCFIDIVYVKPYRFLFAIMKSCIICNNEMIKKKRVVYITTIAKY